MKPTTSTFVFFILTTLFFGCTDTDIVSFDNKSTYKLKVGETMNYYVGYASCCPKCWLNKNSMQTLQLIEEREVKPRPEDCDGCGSTNVYVFKAIKAGQDTIKEFTIAPFDSCSTSLLDSFKEKPKFSIVIVTN